jgi:hypothetical protein
MRNKISMAYTTEKTKLVLTPAYEFRPVGRFIFLQKWLWQWLMKFGALKQHWDETVECKRVDIDRDDFGNRLWEAYSKCFPYTKPKQVFMGPDEFEELARTSQYENRVPFTFDIKMGYNGLLFDLPVTVVPHMNGVLIV